MTLPLDPRDAWSLLSPEAHARVELARWVNTARTFLGAELSLDGDPTEVHPRGELRIAVAPARGPGRATVVRVVTVPLDEAPAVLAAANAGVRAIGGAGMDALVARARRAWQVARVTEGDPRAPLVLAATLASVLLAPVVPPDEVTIFGVRGARVRLEALGWA